MFKKLNSGCEKSPLKQAYDLGGGGGGDHTLIQQTFKKLYVFWVETNTDQNPNKIFF